MHIDPKSYLADQWQATIATRRGRLFLFISVPVLLFAFWFYGIFSPVQKRINGCHYQLAQMNQEAQPLFAHAKTLAGIATQTNALQQKWSAITHQQRSNSTSLDHSSLVECLKKAGLHLESYTIQDTVSKDWYASERFMLQGTGSLSSISAFLTALQKMPAVPSCASLELVSLDYAGNMQFKAELRVIKVKEPSITASKESATQ